LNFDFQLIILLLETLNDTLQSFEFQIQLIDTKYSYENTFVHIKASAYWPYCILLSDYRRNICFSRVQTCTYAVLPLNVYIDSCTRCCFVPILKFTQLSVSKYYLIFRFPAKIGAISCYSSTIHSCSPWEHSSASRSIDSG